MEGSMNRKQISIIVGSIVLTFWVAACGTLIPGLGAAQSNPASQPSRPTFAKEGDLAPEIILKSMTGDQITLSKLEGRPVVVNFWATWCGPCREEFPALVRAYKKYQDKGLVIIGVNFQDEASDDNVLTFMRNSLVNFPIVRDTGERVGRLYNIRGLPTSFFIDKKGVIQDIVVGSVAGYPREDSFLEDELAKILQ
jgi:thiol-disulfide isomerase/thioredoxin